MSNVTETGAENYDWNAEGVYQLEVTDPVEGGADGIANRQATQLAKRTRNLHGRLATVETNKAPLASPALTGVPTAPTAALETNSVQIATTAFVKAVVSALIANAPAALDTINEIANAINNDPNFKTTISALIEARAPLASPALTGVPTAPTAAPETNSTQIATTAFVKAVVSAITASDWNTIANKPLFEGQSALTGTEIDWQSYPVRTKTLTADVTFTFTNLVVNKTITLRITGAFTINWPTSFNLISGVYDGSKVNLIQLLCINSDTPEVWASISQKNV